MKKLKPFHSYCNLDSVTFECPCGDSISGEGEIIGNFIKNHKKHTNGKTVDYITDDGMRTFSKDIKRKRTIKI